MTAIPVYRVNRIRLMELSGVMLPPAVRPGDRVGVAALSGPVDRDSLEQGLEGLRELGFEPQTAENLRSRQGFFAGSDQKRLEAFHALASDPAVRAIFFARGGHGILRLLPQIDWSSLESTPRAYIGYSDLTPFLLEAVSRLGLATFHGPMVATDLARGLDDEESTALRQALSGEFPMEIRVEEAEGDEPVEAPLVGGCLSLLTATLGTPFGPRLDDSILFWEDVNEPLYRIDRMLMQLELSGSLASIRGMVIGKLDLAANGSSGASLRSLVREIADRSEWPVATGCPSGHCQPNLTLPLGLRARLEPRTKRLLLGITTANRIDNK